MPSKRRPAGQPDASLDDLLIEQSPSTSDDTVEIEPQPPADATLQPADAETSDHTERGMLDDVDFQPQERRRPSKLTLALVTILILGVGTLGGIWIQKAAGTSAAMGSGAPAMPGGGQGMPGGGQGMPSGAPSAPSDNGENRSPTEDSDSPAVVGTVTTLKKTELVVTDLGGKTHEVTVSDATTVTVPFSHGELKAGDTVMISGTTSGTTVTATLITVR